MKTFMLPLAAAITFASCSVMADEGFDYSKVNGNSAATYNALNQETTRLNKYTYGNSVAIQALDGRQQDTQAQTNVNTTNIQSLGARADDSDLAAIVQTQRNDTQDVRLAAHDVQFANQDAINDAMSSKLNGLYTDTAGLRNDVRQARREAKEAKAGAAAALAVAGQQFDIHGGFQTAIAASTMGGYQGLAIGAGGALSDHVFLNAAFTTSSSQTGAVVAGTYSW